MKFLMPSVLECILILRCSAALISICKLLATNILLLCSF